MGIYVGFLWTFCRAYNALSSHGAVLPIAVLNLIHKFAPGREYPRLVSRLISNYKELSSSYEIHKLLIRCDANGSELDMIT